MGVERRPPRPTRTRRLLDATQYALALTAVVAGLSAALGVALGGLSAAAVAAKFGLFFGGTLHLGYATVKTWVGSRAPALRQNGFLARLRDASSLGDGDSRGGSGPSLGGDETTLAEPTGFQRLVRRLPPAAWFPVRADDRIGDGGRLFLASGAMFLVSFLSEAVLGVTL